MSKRFKDFDKKYSSYKGKLLPGEEEILPSDCLKMKISGFPLMSLYRDHLKAVDNTIIAYAVYESPTADEWQKFRVSLKGMSTEKKLVRLERRVYAMQIKHGSTSTECELEFVRIFNYIGALIRGGLVDEKGHIIK